MDGLNALGEQAAQSTTASAIDSFFNGLTSGGQTAASIITALKAKSPTGTVTAQEILAAQQAAEAQKQANISKYLIIGGITIGAIALILKMRSK